MDDHNRGDNRHVYQCPIRWGDMDALGHVNNGRYVDYLQDARVDFLFRTAKELGADELETGLLVARHEVQYRRPLVHRPEPVLIALWISEIKAASFVVDYEIYDPDPHTTYVEARTRLVPFDFGANRLRRITPVERVALEKLVGS
ncbi:acyl-CoA thioesterase [Kribbella catacumbae]|uniref:acyl-CoA thioesterase n=1 Tax=Kribbella catacumbae TaxID=460086 RepID=UPI00036223EA|nr:thioesterase family protein [Kribbella catacumbae]